MLGFIGLPISIALYWLVLRPKRQSPFPKTGLIRLAIATVISVALSTLLTLPISGVITLARTGVFSDFSGFLETLKSNPGVLKEMTANLADKPLPGTLWNMVDMFFGAGLLEEGLKFLTCRLAIRKEGMVRTWMDSVAAFAFVGITFEMIENVAFGGAELLNVIFRALSPVHFVFGVIMGYFWGKYRVTGLKRYGVLSLAVPVLYHTVTNGLMTSMELSKVNSVIGGAAAISHIAAGILTVIVLILWQKRGTLNVPVPEKQAPEDAPEESAS